MDNCMKRNRIIFILIVLLGIGFVPGCSKKSLDREKETQASKTVDLGETEDDKIVQGDESDAKEADVKEAKDAKANRDAKDSAHGRGIKKRDADKAVVGEAVVDKAEKADGNGSADNVPEPEDAKNGGRDDGDSRAAEKTLKKGGEADAEGKADAAEGFDFADEDLPAPPEVRRPKPRVGLDIERLINIRELREQTNYAGALSEAWLLGQTPDARYNAMRLATDNANELGFSVQVWKPGNESAAVKRFNDLYSQSFGGKKIKALATDAFVSTHHEIHEIGFFDKGKRAAVLLSCSAKVCTTAQLQAIAVIIQRRL